jgi:hypothetical protein
MRDMLDHAKKVLALLALVFSATANANTVVITAPSCEPPQQTFNVPVGTFVTPVSFNCPQGINYAGGGGGTFGFGATHVHSLVVVNPPGGGEGPYDITSGPYTTNNGFSIFTLIRGFASYQGNPGGTFSWTATLTATFLGGLSTVTSAGSVSGSPQKRIFVFDRQNYPGVKGTDNFFSSLTITTSGPGELHLERTGIAGLAVVEPATWAMLIMGFGLVGATMRRARRQVLAY